MQEPELITKKQNVYEWAIRRENIQIGCEHGCKYPCYAFTIRHHYDHITWEDWLKPKINLAKAQKRIILSTKHKEIKAAHPELYDFMFPTSSDITPLNIGASRLKIHRMIQSTGSILIVSKPHFECILAIISDPLVQRYKAKMDFRFTVGSLDDAVIQHWETATPLPEERLRCIRYVVGNGFRCTISMEPLLETEIPRITTMIQTLEAAGVSEIWIGAVQYSANAPRLNFRAIYENIKLDPKIKWKSSFQKHLKLK